MTSSLNDRLFRQSAMFASSSFVNTRTLSPAGDTSAMCKSPQQKPWLTYSSERRPASARVAAQFGCHRSAYSQTCALLWRALPTAQVWEYRDLWHPNPTTDAFLARRVRDRRLGG